MSLLVRAELLSNHNHVWQLFHHDFNSEMLLIHLATQRIPRPGFRNQDSVTSPFGGEESREQLVLAVLERPQKTEIREVG